MNWLDSPYKHVTGIGYFSDELYAEMLKNLPPDESYKVYPSYPLRHICPISGGFWKGIADKLTNGKRARVQLVRDFPGYFIKPHTDSRKDIWTMLFYLTDTEQETGGTSIFVPKKQGLTCDGTKQHDFDGFDLVKTAPYVPNGYYGHIRSDNSFHGVVPCDFTRNTLQVNFY